MAIASDDESSGSWELISNVSLTALTADHLSDLQVRFRSIHGVLLYEGTFPRDISSEKLYEMASEFPFSQNSASGWQLSLTGKEILPRDSLEPLKVLSSVQHSVDLIAWRSDPPRCEFFPVGMDQLSLVDLIRRGSWTTATEVLEQRFRSQGSSFFAHLVHDEVLSWAVYKSKGSPQAALKFVLKLLGLRPQLALQQHPCTGFLPLHDAAWGHAPATIAVALLAARPDTLHRGCVTNEKPLDIGYYYHFRSFTWPSGEVLLQRASELRQKLKQLTVLSRLRKDPLSSLLHGQAEMPWGALARNIGLPLDAGLRIEALLDISDPPVGTYKYGNPGLFAAPSISHRLPAADSTAELCRGFLYPVVKRRQPRGVTFFRRQRPPRGCCPSEESRAPLRIDAIDEAVTYLREAMPKAHGRYAGARQVRHCRCSLDQLEKVSLEGGVVFNFRHHSVVTVQKAVQNVHSLPKWSSKPKWQLERARERLECCRGISPTLFAKDWNSFRSIRLSRQIEMQENT
jgi:hypothetical protein